MRTIKSNLIGLITLFICGGLYAQPLYKFRKPVAVGATWKFVSVVPGVNAIVSITNSKNATINAIDDSSVYPYSWQPKIKYTNATTHATDSSYIEFTVNFVKSTGAASVQSSVAMTIVDCDGPGSSAYLEIVRTSLPCTGKLKAISSIKTAADSRWEYFKSDTSTFANIDTINYAAMAQVNYTNISTFVMRVGIVGKVSAGTIRDASFYFKPFSMLTVPLPVKLISFEAQVNNQNRAELSWETASEIDNAEFVVEKSADGNYFEAFEAVRGKGTTYNVNYYTVEDANPYKGSTFYRLKQMDNNGQFQYSEVIEVFNPGDADNGINVYPVPTSGVLNIATESKLNYHMVILNAEGKSVYEGIHQAGMSSVDLSDFPSGIYFITMENGSRLFHLRFSKL